MWDMTDIINQETRQPDEGRRNGRRDGRPDGRLEEAVSACNVALSLGFFDAVGRRGRERENKRGRELRKYIIRPLTETVRIPSRPSFLPSLSLPLPRARAWTWSGFGLGTFFALCKHRLFPKRDSRKRGERRT